MGERRLKAVRIRRVRAFVQANDERRLRELAALARDAMRVALDTDVTRLAFDDQGLVRLEPKAR